MNRSKNHLVLSLSISLLAACSGGAKSADSTATAAAPVEASAADVIAIRDISKAWYAHYNAHHPDSVAALYADNAILMMPGAPAARGRDAIRTALAKDIAATEKAGYSDNQGKDSNISVSGSIGWESNTYTITDKAGKQIEAGKYVTVFARKDGKWVIVRDIWNSDGASPTP